MFFMIICLVPPAVFAILNTVLQGLQNNEKAVIQSKGYIIFSNIPAKAVTEYRDPIPLAVENAFILR
jgi:hypothetical protein